jgi:hypothetical protein
MLGIFVFSFICIVLCIEMTLTKTAIGVPIRVPPYLQFLGLLVLYQMVTAIFISVEFMRIGAVKYVYSNSYVRAFLAFLILENTSFSIRSLNIVKRLILPILVLGAVVAIIQISDPFYFTDPYMFLSEEATSIEKVQRLLREGTVTSLSKLSNAGTRFLVEGYRNSIFSWVNTTSVGLDSLSLFSIVIGLKSYSKIQKIIVWVASALISFLCSYRWVMLNFIVLSSQLILTKKSLILNSVKFIILLTVILIGFYYTAPLLGIDIQKFVEERLLSESAGTRLYAFEVFGNVFPENGIWGTGAKDTDAMNRLIRGKTGQIHVGYLKFLYYYGIAGFLIYLVFLFFLFRYLFALAKRTKYWGSFFAFLAVLIANLTLVDMSFDHYGLYLAMIFAKYVNKDHLFEQPNGK